MVGSTDGTDNARRTLTGHTESHSTILNIRTADVHLDGRNTVQSVNTAGTLGIIGWTAATDVHNHIRVDVLNLRIDILNEIVDTLILQTHTVEHALGRLGHSRIVVALAGMEVVPLTMMPPIPSRGTRSANSKP